MVHVETMAFLAIEQQSTTTVPGEYRGRGMLGYDAHTHQYHFSMFNKAGDSVKLLVLVNLEQGFELALEETATPTTRTPK